MPEKTMYRKALCISLALGALLCAMVYFWYAPTQAFLVGSIGGVVCMMLGLRLFFSAWHAAPNKANVALYYGLRLAIVFGSVLAAMFVPFVNALGVLLPQMFPVPVLAVLMLFPDFTKGGRP